LNGYVADETGNFDRAELSDEVHAIINSREWQIGTYLFRRKMDETLAVWESPDVLLGIGRATNPVRDQCSMEYSDRAGIKLPTHGRGVQGRRVEAGLARNGGRKESGGRSATYGGTGRVVMEAARTKRARLSMSERVSQIEVALELFDKVEPGRALQLVASLGGIAALGIGLSADAQLPNV
jgi:hypothetical protein